MLGVIGATVIDEQLPVGQAHLAFDDHGDLIDPDVRSALVDLVAELVASARPRLRESA